jgi:seryl-tRNA synthetase
MINIKDLENNPNKFKENLKNRNFDDITIIDEIIKLSKERKALITEVESLRNKKKEISKKFGENKKEGKSTSSLEQKISANSKKSKENEEKLKNIEEEYNNKILFVPNILLDSTPIGKDEKDNKEIRTWGKKPKFNFNPKDHIELGEMKDIIDLKRATKVTGSRFTFMKGLGARLERSLINFMLDIHTKENAYQEILSPLIVNDKSLLGTGQLPKFEEDLFKLDLSKMNYYLIPTAEVPVTNYFSNEILEEKILPVKFVCFSSCFRSEAGSYGKDTKGIIRQHQFNKVELVKITSQENSEKEHEELTKDAEKILQKLGLHYRVVALSSGDIGFGAAKCYDIEVWLPSQNQYREISSCSNYLDFQSRRAKIRYRDTKTGKTKLTHTINGSGLAIGRTLVAILENYQNKDGSIIIPEALKPYMQVDKI